MSELVQAVVCGWFEGPYCHEREESKSPSKLEDTSIHAVNVETSKVG